ncbi:MAG: hypothetical protein ABIT37_14775 [Luteolibacter sp.]
MKVRLLKIPGGLAMLCAFGAFYYYFGNHDCIGSRSYQLEKEIRNLLFLETHEVVNYPEALVKYEQLAPRIRFHDGGINYTERYAKAIRRTRVKAGASELFDDYARTSDVAKLAQGWALLNEPAYEKDREYGFSVFYWNGESINQEWIDSKMGKAGSGAERR